ncbi:MAG: sterol desaturase/sphingolipid hydroxylase (fatty acid hydroxylase superfamily) [Crocinitomicaceae bacterium]|jgi:sterol desaturase/sphingolipid hydroxylase (fatty acid hydroxylase superfamily)
MKSPDVFLDKLLAAGGFLNVTLTVILINLGITLGTLLIELLILGWERSSIKRLLKITDKSVMGDLMCWLLSLVGLYDFLVFLSTLGLFYFLTGIIQSNFYVGVGEWLHNDVLIFAFVFILSDFKHYLWHFTMHKLGAFWEIHKYHHSATSMNMITTSRGHFLGKAILIVFDAFFFALIGSPPMVYASWFIIREIWAMWLHSDVNIQLGWFGRFVFVTPYIHRVHHSANQAHFDKNFGTFFITWDRIFGTYHRPEKVEEIGIANDPYNTRGFWYDMQLGFRLFLQKIIPFNSPK